MLLTMTTLGAKALVRQRVEYASPDVPRSGTVLCSRPPHRITVADLEALEASAKSALVDVQPDRVRFIAALIVEMIPDLPDHLDARGRDGLCDCFRHFVAARPTLTGH